VIDSGVIFSRKLGYQAAIFAAGVLLNVSLNLALIPRWGYMAAAYVTLVSYVAVAVAAFFVSNRLYRMEVERRRLGIVMASALAVLVLGTAAAGAAPLPGLAVRVALFSCLAGFWYLFVLSDRERRRIHQMAARSL
jgi:O-antigen/teichoic acid export membrane protein